MSRNPDRRKRSYSSCSSDTSTYDDTSMNFFNPFLASDRPHYGRLIPRSKPIALPPPPPKSNVPTGPQRPRPFAQLNGDPAFVGALDFVLSRTVDRGRTSNAENWIMHINIETSLQTGPSCGILALSIVSSLLRPWSSEELLSLAQSRGYTKQGEMFSVFNMWSLAKSTIGNLCDDISINRRHVFSHSPDIVWKNLLNNQIYLLPYDKDKDNGPGFFKGHKAHWAAIIGCGSVNGTRFYCAAQGKSTKLSLWDTKLLAKSNDQLLEVNPEISKSSEYVSCNIKDELAGHSIAIKFKKQTQLPIAEANDLSNRVIRLVKLLNEE